MLLQRQSNITLNKVKVAGLSTNIRQSLTLSPHQTDTPTFRSGSIIFLRDFVVSVSVRWYLSAWIGYNEVIHPAFLTHPNKKKGLKTIILTTATGVF